MIRIVLTGLALAFMVNAAGAGEAKDSKVWFQNFVNGLKMKVSKKLESKNRVTSVAAVRGAKQGAGDPKALYWKGGVSEKARKKLEAEKEQLSGAAQLVLDGKPDEGRLALEKFLKDNPDSFFAQDAREALSNLPAPEAAPEAKPAEAPKAPAGQ